MPARASHADETGMLRAGHGLIICVIALLTFGVVMVNSAGLSVRAEAPVDLPDILLGRHTMLAALAVGAMLLGATVPVRRLVDARGATSPVPWIVLAMILLLLAVHLPGVGREVNGARRWLTFGPIGFQPSEFAKWGMIIVLAWHATRHGDRIGRLLRGFAAPMLVVGVVCALIAMEDLGTAVLIAVVAVALLVAAGCRLWHAMLLMPLGAAGFLAALITSPYRIDRIRAFLNPYDDPQGIGYHIIQSIAAINSGGLAGRGLGNSVRKFGYLPEDTTDFIFAIICEELGVVGAIAVVALYVLLLGCALSILRRATHAFERLVALGVMLTIGGQALINVAVVTGSAPTKGIALPLLSAGGTGWILTAFAIGLLVSIDRGLAQSDRAISGECRGAPRGRTTPSGATATAPAG